jgi:hypothetical protein
MKKSPHRFMGIKGILFPLLILSLISLISSSWDGSSRFVIPNQTACSGSFSGLNPCSNAYDGDFNTYASCSSGTCEIYRNYTLPFPLNSSSIFQVRDCSTCPGSPNYANLTIPSACLNYDSEKLIFMNNATVGSVSMKWYCKNSTGWNFLRDSGGAFTDWETALFSFGDKITLTSPEDSSIVKSSLYHNCSALITTGAEISNISLYSNSTGSWALNETKIITGVSNSTYFLKNYDDNKRILWTCGACDTNNNCGTGVNYTFLTDAYDPVLNVTAPTGFINYSGVNLNLTLNWNVTDTNINQCWFSQGGINTTVTCSANTTSFKLLDYITNLTFYANDSAGNIAVDTQSWDYKVFMHSLSYNPTTIEGSVESFILNITTSNPLSSIYLIYNGTSYNPDVSTSGNYSVVSNNITIPLTDALSVYNFYYPITLSDGTSVNTSTYTQSSSIFNIDNCTSYTRRIYNITLYDENTLNGILNTSNPIMEFLFNLYDTSRTTLILNTSGIIKGNFTSLCFSSNNINSSKYSIDMTISYKADNYVTEYYNIINSVFENSSATELIDLYPLLSSNSTEFQATVYGDDYFPLENALIYLQRQYISLNRFITVEIPKTDTNGQAILHFIRNSIPYNIIVIKDGEVVTSYNNIVAFCDDYTIGNCKIILNSNSTETEVYNYDEEIGLLYSDPYFDETAKKVYFSFNTIDNTNKNVSMFVYNQNISNASALCSDSLSFSSGTLNCLIGLTDENNLKVDIYVDGNRKITQYLIINRTGLGIMGNIAMFFFAIALILLFSNSKVGVLLGVLLGFISGISLGMINGTMIGIGASGIWLIIILIIAFYKIKSTPGDTG